MRNGFCKERFSLERRVCPSRVSICLSVRTMLVHLADKSLWQQQELDRMKSELSRIANVQLLKKKSIISLISNVKQSSAVLEKVCMQPYCYLHSVHTNVN